VEKTKIKERKKISLIAKKYLDEDYKVYCELRGYKRPYEINGVIPDLIAAKGKEIIIIEVKSSKELKSHSEEIKKLAEFAFNNKMRFDLVITNPSLNYHIVPKGHEWAIVGGGHASSVTTTTTKSEAEKRGRQIAKSASSELIIHGKDGRIRERVSYGTQQSSRKK
jgi:hypothetical protein